MSRMEKALALAFLPSVVLAEVLAEADTARKSAALYIAKQFRLLGNDCSGRLRSSFNSLTTTKALDRHYFKYCSRNKENA